METFYSETPDDALRFGDVLQGVVLASPAADTLLFGSSFTIAVSKPNHAVIMSPCCSIGNEVISVCPLLPVQKSYFANPYFAEDMTRMNRKMNPQCALAPKAWEKLSPEQKAQRLEKGEEYAFVEMFIYDENDLLPVYQLGQGKEAIKTHYYQIDFRHITRVSCKEVTRNNQTRIDNKILQLSIDARQELREKIVHFYHRIPLEDKMMLG